MLNECKKITCFSSGYLDNGLVRLRSVNEECVPIRHLDVVIHWCIFNGISVEVRGGGIVDDMTMIRYNAFSVFVVKNIFRNWDENRLLAIFRQKQSDAKCALTIKKMFLSIFFTKKFIIALDFQIKRG
jgi:hypothetical protein